MLEKYQLSLLPDEAFGMPPYFRLNFGVKVDTFAAALHCLEELK
jgi:hypothetical protein